ncbi:MAG: pilus assembly protein PilM [Desulfitobacterium hafniense]|nr:pilus assembly protein PilM [Desulfitobacterium hafniense]
MFTKKHWIAVVRGKRWVVAKVSRRKFKLNIHRLAEFNGENPYPIEFIEGTQSSQTALQLAEQKGEEEFKNQLLHWLKQNKVPLKKLNLAISCPGVITRMITLPILSAKDLDKLLTEQVDQYFTFNIADYVVDYRILEKFVEDGQERLRILLAALPKYQWEKQWELWKNLGLSPKVTDLAADCLARLYSRVSRRGDEKTNSESEKLPDIAIVDLGVDRVEFVLLEHGVFFLYSDMEINLEGLVEYASSLSVVEKNSNSKNPEDVESLAADLGPVELTEIWVRNEMEGILNPVMNTLADFFNFFAARHFGKSVDCIYLTGEYSDQPFIGEIFEKNLEIETRVGFPKGWRPYFGRRLNILQKTWMKYGGLYGLAFRED